jgi:hypothetical protein
MQLCNAQQALLIWSALWGRTATSLLGFQPNFGENTTKGRDVAE